VTGVRDDEQIAADIRALIARAADELARADARDEALARFVPARRTFVIMRRPVMVPLGRVWRLGVFLLGVVRAGEQTTLYATGSTTRAIEPGRPGYQSQSAEIRRAYRAAAFAGPFDRGETVNFDARVIDLHAERLRASSGPLVIQGERPMVRWTTAMDEATISLDEYLKDRVALLTHPPDGA
jgi:hypothetical protein